MPDNIVWKVLEKRLLQNDARNGFIIDGYPRTVKQARTLDSHVRLDAVLELDMPDKALKKIALGRRICKCSTDEATEKNAASKSSVSNDKDGCIDVGVYLTWSFSKIRNWELISPMLPKGT